MAWAKIEDSLEIIPNGYKIKASTIFDFEELYIEMQRWFVHFGYNWTETRYLISDLPNGSRLSEISWVCNKKVDEYVSYNFNVDFKATISDVEVNIDNVKKKMNKGSVEFRFKGTMNKNTKVWEKKFFGQLLGAIYEKILIRDRLSETEDRLLGESNKFFDEIKTYLNIK
ncbi:MAG: hypothetical protein KKA65_02215 [Nanoarchaeota archaeon]|nr:hypothetical protein [Nanoarchaeota archaeon]MBU4351483.1 hypothetical protein [Nanoarchaeota archaeon]MBU4456291.1 hypothetical protein [Nanoarchaeota archaeon]MCG2720141.1 hypothetical protein [Nanoarchaeota archaeon]